MQFHKIVVLTWNEGGADTYSVTFWREGLDKSEAGSFPQAYWSLVFTNFESQREAHGGKVLESHSRLKNGGHE
jgi:hypothetical protein